jgi:hypothetical protein
MTAGEGRRYSRVERRDSGVLRQHQPPPAAKPAITPRREPGKRRPLSRWARDGEAWLGPSVLAARASNRAVGWLGCGEAAG